MPCIIHRKNDIDKTAPHRSPNTQNSKESPSAWRDVTQRTKQREEAKLQHRQYDFINGSQSTQPRVRNSGRTHNIFCAKCQPLGPTWQRSFFFLLSFSQSTISTTRHGRPSAVLPVAETRKKMSSCRSILIRDNENNFYRESVTPDALRFFHERVNFITPESNVKFHSTILFRAVPRPQKTLINCTALSAHHFALRDQDVESSNRQRERQQQQQQQQKTSSFSKITS